MPLYFVLHTLKGDGQTVLSLMHRAANFLEVLLYVFEIGHQSDGKSRSFQACN